MLLQVLKDMIFPNCEKLGQTIIFVRTRDMARQLHQIMDADGHRCTSIQGDMDHADRDRVVTEFRNGTTKILISTDVLSRGFDVSQVRGKAGRGHILFAAFRSPVGLSGIMALSALYFRSGNSIVFYTLIGVGLQQHEPTAPVLSCDALPCFRTSRR